MRRVVENYAELPRFIRKPLWRLWHNWIISRERREVVMTCMNYGYAGLESPETIDLLPVDGNERYGLQMYHQAASWCDITGKDVLEVGSGRGGGASYLARYLRPRSYTGIDLSEAGIRFCNEYHKVDNLRFVKGDAEAIPFDDDSFDAVVNVESSRCYPNIMRFFSEVKRVLRPEGHFLLTDVRWKEDMGRLREQLLAAGFRSVGEREVTPNVVRALDADNERKTMLIGRKVPRMLIRTLGEFAAVHGSPRYERLASGDMQYWSFDLVQA